MHRLPILSCLALAACGGLARDTEVAATEASRLAMAASVVPGVTTETDLALRWGNPTQKAYRGGQTEFIYRDMTNPVGWYVLEYGDSRDYVIVTFQYGVATAVRTSDGIDCHASFPPRPPGPGFDTPATVRLIGACAPEPGTLPERGGIRAILANWTGRALDGLANGIGGRAQASDADRSRRPGVAEDAYLAPGSAGK